MMLERAMFEAKQGKLQAAVQLARTVVLTYPLDDQVGGAAQRQTEQQLLGPIDHFDEAQIIDLITALSKFRGTYGAEQEVPGDSSSEINISESDIAVAIISKIVPEFEYSAHRLYERFKHETSLQSAPRAAGLAFGGGDVPKELIQLLLACMPVIQFIAGIGLGGFLPAFLSGRKSEQQLEEITDLLRQREDQDDKWREVITKLRSAHTLARNNSDSTEIESLLADALDQAIEVQQKQKDQNQCGG